MPLNNTSFRMIQDIDIEKKQILLADYIYNTKTVYNATLEEVEFYFGVFAEALDKNIFLSVEYDEEKGVIVH